MRLAACSCGHVFHGPALMQLAPPTEEMVRIMVAHWRDGHDVVAAGPTAFQLIGIVARRMAAHGQRPLWNRTGEEIRDELRDKVRRWREFGERS